MTDSGPLAQERPLGTSLFDKDATAFNTVCVFNPAVCVTAATDSVADVVAPLLRLAPFLVEAPTAAAAAPALVVSPLVLTCGDSSGCGAAEVLRIDPKKPARDVLPGSLHREFPGEHLDKSLDEIKDLLRTAKGREKQALQKAKKLLEQSGRLLGKPKG